MKIAIIGAGNVGRALGGGWRTDHDITYGLRSPGDAKYADLDAPTATNETAVAGTDVVVLCTPWQGTEQAVKACGDLTGKVLIDCTNPLTPDVTALEIGHTTSGAEQIAAWAPGARVCKAMNQIGAPAMDHPQFFTAPVMFVCGDDQAAKHVTADLVTQLGFEAVDAGDLTLAPLRRGFGTDWGFALAKRNG
jgi:8-hydroxy-5-deazaflavin:NADPH oxidoreductase